MKILVVGHKDDAQRDLSILLMSKGATVLGPFEASSKETWETLQAEQKGIDLAIIHREGKDGQGEPGIELVRKIKADPVQVDLPIIITSSVWGDAEFVLHQGKAEGVNAYLHAPFAPTAVWDLVTAVLGSAPVLEDASTHFTDTTSGGTGSLSLELETGVKQDSQPALVQPSVAESPTLEGITMDAIEIVEEKTSVALPEAPYDRIVSEVSIPTAPSFDGIGVTLSAEPDAVIEMGGTAKEPILSAPSTESPLDADAAEKMPYVYGRDRVSREINDPLLGFGMPIGDAVVPGGAAESPDLETLKKYLLLREQDVGALSNQLKTSREQIQELERCLILERGKVVELEHTSSEQKQKIDDFDREKAATIQSFEEEITELNFQIKSKTDRARLLETKVREVTEQMEHLKERVRADIRKIRMREKELENRLEILKKDSESLIAARENKIIELKRKVDLLEFNMDLLQEQSQREKQNNSDLRERFSKAAQAMKVAGGLLGDENEDPVEVGATHTQEASY